MGLFGDKHKKQLELELDGALMAVGFKGRAGGPHVERAIESARALVAKGKADVAQAVFAKFAKRDVPVISIGRTRQEAASGLARAEQYPNEVWIEAIAAMRTAAGLPAQDDVEGAR